MKKVTVISKEKKEENSEDFLKFISDENNGDSSMDPNVLKKLKEKREGKEAEERKEDSVVVVDEKNVSINISVIGVGQAGSRVAEEFHKLKYDVGVINTSSQDLEFIDVMPNQKLLLTGSLGGTGKDLDLGRDIFSEYEEELSTFVDDIIEGNDMVYLAVSGGGGTGASSVDTMVPLLYSKEIPVGVIFVLPKATEDAKSKRNSIESLSRLASMTSESMVSSLIVVDNARIEQIYANMSQSKFWQAANSAIVEPLHIFNTLTSTPSAHTSLDPSDFGKIISCGDCSVYGTMIVEDYMEETALAEAAIDSLSSSMLADGFDLKQARVGGLLITGSKEALDKLPAININYCYHVISEQTNGASIFRGIYETESQNDEIKIIAWFAGLGLPKDRIDSLKRESKEKEAIIAEKEKSRVASMKLDLDNDKVNSVTEEVTRKIKKKRSGFNKLQRGSRSGRPSIIDRRKRR